MPWHRETQEYLGTKIYLELESGQADLSAIWDIAEKLEQKFSRFRNHSQLSRFNQQLNQWHEIDAQWENLLRQAAVLKTLTKGAFDITVQATLEDWGYDADYSLTEKALRPALGEVTLKPGKFKATAPIDLGSVGKGYFLDLVRSWLKDQNIENAFINAGGDLWARGTDQTDKAWPVFFEDPRNEKRVIGETVVDDLFCCSSSPLRRQWRDRHHLVETTALAPACDMKAIYVQHADSGVYCDGLSTALFVMGFAAAQDLAIEKNLAVMLIGPTGEIWQSSTFIGNIYTI